MVIAHHLVFTTYGFWLPNDLRGSWSNFVRTWELYWYGLATKVTTRRSLAHDPHNRDLRNIQKTALRYSPVRFTPKQIACVALGFERAITESGYQILACSILPEHVHLVARRHSNFGERIIGHLKTRATQQLLAEELHPFQSLRTKSGEVPPAWVSRGWKVFLETDSDIKRAVRYVEANPIKARSERQNWTFVATNACDPKSG